MGSHRHDFISNFRFHPRIHHATTMFGCRGGDQFDIRRASVISYGMALRGKVTMSKTVDLSDPLRRRNRKFKRLIDKLNDMEFDNVTNPETGVIFPVGTLRIDLREMQFLRSVLQEFLEIKKRNNPERYEKKQFVRTSGD